MQKLIVIMISILSISIAAQDNINFETDLIDGNEISVSELYKDGPLLVNFWALWCKPCRAEMKELNKLYQKYSQDGFTILGINLDTPRSAAKVNSFVSALGIEYKIGLDPNSKIFESLNGQVVPLNLLYDSDGKLVYRHTGYLPGDEFKLEEEIKKVLSSDAE